MNFIPLPVHGDPARNNPGHHLRNSLQKGISVHEHVLTRHEVYISDECFLTGTAAEIIPVVCVDGRKIGAGRPGKLTLNLGEEFHKVTKKEGVKY